MKDLIQIHPDDNVAVAIAEIPPGTSWGNMELQGVPAGHKVALADIKAGDTVMKYGFPIGRATVSIRAGDHVHSHNMATLLSDQTELRYEEAPPVHEQGQEMPTFLGYRRPDGRAATRNEIWIINTVACVNVPSQRIAEIASRRHVVPGGVIDGIHAFTHPYGCSQLGDDLGLTQKILAGLASHPNAAGVLILGLGCENNSIRSFLARTENLDPARIRYFNAQEVGDEIEHGLEAIDELVGNLAGAVRVPIPASELVVGIKCGGSDGFSGITANPLVGRATDRLCGWGGTVLMTEVPEMFGAEAPLFSRCSDEETFAQAVAMVNDFKDYFRRHDEPIYENPSPGNKEGGITTLEEKSLGCIQKGGTAPVKGVSGYGETVKQGMGGLCLIEAPGNDGVSATALAAAGAHCVLFTTGRVTPLGVPVPTLKISSNRALAEGKPNWIDFDASPLLGPDADPQSVTDDLIQVILSTASGQLAKNEENGFREITIWKQGVTL